MDKFFCIKYSSPKLASVPPQDTIISLNSAALAGLPLVKSHESAMGSFEKHFPSFHSTSLGLIVSFCERVFLISIALSQVSLLIKYKEDEEHPVKSKKLAMLKTNTLHICEPFYELNNHILHNFIIKS